MASYRYNSVKFNRANLAGVDSDVISGLNKFLNARERELNTINTSTANYKDGPFQGMGVELTDGGAGMLPISVKGWVGHYAGGKWEGTTGAPLAMPVQAESTKAKASELPARGFDLLGDFLCELSADPTDRIETVTDVKTNSFTHAPADDFGNEIATPAQAGRYAVHPGIARSVRINNKFRSVTGPAQVSAYGGNFGNSWAVDDFGDLFEIKPGARTSQAGHWITYTQARQVVRYTIGRTVFTVAATTEAIDKLRAKILAKKKWFADKLLSVARQVQNIEAITQAARQDVAELVANAQAAAAIEQASQAAPLGVVAEVAELADCVATGAAQAAAPDHADNRITSEHKNNSSGSFGKLKTGEAFQFPNTAGVFIKTSGGARPGCGGELFKVQSAQTIVKYDPGSECSAPTPAPTPAPAAAPRQAIKGKSGNWSATFYSALAGQPVMEFKTKGHADFFNVQVCYFDDASQRMAALQRMAREADETPAASDCADTSKTPDAPAFDPETVDVMQLQAHDVQAYTAQEFSALYSHLEHWNNHNECLLIDALRAGCADVATEARALIALHLEERRMSPAMIEKRSALQARINAAKATDCTDPRKTPATDCTDPRKTSDEPEFVKTRPVALDLRALLAEGMKPAELIGFGVAYSGGMANPSGTGAIVNAEADKWAGVLVMVQLEDGREISTNAASFGDKAGNRYRLDFKHHGAPYLAQLAAAVASKRAQASSADELAKQAHAQALQDLAAEFPQLTRAGNTYTGGKLAAVNMRILLKATFKGVKFSVTSDYNSVRVNWTDGPTDAQVNATIGRFNIGASDSQSDYFYTVRTAFSDLFGGVQYLNTSRELSDAAVTAIIAQAWPEAQERPTMQDYRNNAGVFGWGDDNYWTRDKFKQTAKTWTPAGTVQS